MIWERIIQIKRLGFLCNSSLTALLANMNQLNSHLALLWRVKMFKRLQFHVKHLPPYFLDSIVHKMKSLQIGRAHV